MARDLRRAIEDAHALLLGEHNEAAPHMRVRHRVSTMSFWQ